MNTEIQTATCNEMLLFRGRIIVRVDLIPSSMNRNYLLFFLLFSLVICDCYKAQNVGINATGTAPNNSAMLDVSSTTKGFLLPRMTTAQMVSIPSPAIGLMVYNLDCNLLQYWNGTVWVKVSTSTYNAFITNSITFNYTGGIQTFTVPQCASTCTIKVWGGAGGAGGADAAANGGRGGGGAYSTVTVSVIPGNVLQVWVGQGGGFGSSNVTNGAGGAGGWGYCNGGPGGNSGSLGASGCGAGGGGSSAVRNSSSAVLLAVASGGGGGGGAGNAAGNSNGGAGGGGGQNGFVGGTGANGGTTGANGTCVGQNGLARGAADGGGSGGGGGGNTNGGTAGGVNTAVSDYGAGGGAGGNSLGNVTNGAGFTPGNSTDPDLCAGCAVGGAVSANGANGFVKIYWD